MALKSLQEWRQSRENPKTATLPSFSQWKGARDRGEQLPIAPPVQKKSLLGFTRQNLTSAVQELNPFRKPPKFGDFLQREVPRVPERIIQGVGTVLGGGAGAIAGGIAAPISFTKAKFQGKSTDVALQEAAKTAEGTARFGAGLATQAIPSLPVFLAGAVKRLGRQALIGLSKDEKKKQGFKRQTVRDAIDTYANISGKPIKISDQELDTILSTPEGKIGILASLAVDAISLIDFARTLNNGSRATKQEARLRKVADTSARDILGVSKNATDDEIRSAYRRQAHIFHPDQPGGSAETMAKINVAYNYLSTGKGAENVSGIVTKKPLLPEQSVAGKSFSDFLDAAKEQSAKQVERIRPEYGQIVRATDVSKSPNIATAENLVLANLKKVGAPENVLTDARAYFKSFEQVRFLQNVEGPAIKGEGVSTVGLPPREMPAAPPEVTGIKPSQLPTQPVVPRGVTQPQPIGVPPVPVVPTRQPLVQAAPPRPPQPLSIPVPVPTEPSPAVPAERPLPQPARPVPEPVTPKYNVDLKNARVQDPKSFFVYNKDTDSFVPIEGKPVKIVPNVDTFVHLDLRGRGFTVSEGRSGIAIASGKTRTKAVQATVPLLTRSLARLDQVVSNAVSMSGISPRYTTLPVEAEKPSTVSPAELSPREVAEMEKIGIPEKIIKTAKRKPLYTEPPIEPKPAQVPQAQKPIVSAPSPRPIQVEKPMPQPKPAPVVEKPVVQKPTEAKISEATFGTKKITPVEIPSPTPKDTGASRIVSPKDFVERVAREIPEFKKNPVVVMTEKGFKVPSGGETYVKPKALGFIEDPPIGTKVTFSFDKTKVTSVEVKMPSQPSIRLITTTTDKLQSFGMIAENQRRIMETVDRSKIPEDQKVLIKEFVAKISDKLWDTIEVIVRDSELPQSKNVLGETSQRAILSLVKIYTKAIRNQVGAYKISAAETFIHEFFHALTRYLPDGVVENLRSTFALELKNFKKSLTVKQLKAFEEIREANKAGQEFSKEAMNILPDRTYRYINLDEWVTSLLTEREMATFPGRSATILGKLRDLLRTILNEVRRGLKKIFRSESAIENVYKNLTESKYEQFYRDRRNLRGEGGIDYLQTLKPSEELKLRLSDIEIPQERMLFSSDFARERSVFEYGWTDEHIGEIVVENQRGRYVAVAGEDILRGLTRRRVHGMSIPERIPVRLRGETQVDSSSPRPFTAAEKQELERLGYSQESVNTLDGLEREAMSIAEASAESPGKATNLLNRTYENSGLLTRMLTHEVIGRYVQSPHLRFKEVFWDLYGAVADVSTFNHFALKKLSDFYKKNKLGGIRYRKQERILQDYFDDSSSVSRGQEPIHRKLSEYPQKTVDLAKRMVEEVGDPAYSWAVDRQILSAGQYIPSYAPTLYNVPARPFSSEGRTDLTFNAWMTKHRGRIRTGKRPILFESWRQYFDRLHKKAFLEPQLEQTKQEIASVYTNNPVLLNDALEWLEYVREPYQFTGSELKQSTSRKLRLISTLFRQGVASTHLGARTVVRNINWGLQLLTAEVGPKYVARANRKFATKEGIRIVSEIDPALLEEAMPMIYGTYGSPLEGTVKAITVVQRKLPSAFLQMSSESYLRRVAILSGYYQGKDMGLTGRQLWLHARRVVVETQQTYWPIDLPKAFRGTKGSIVGQFIMPQLKQMNQVLYATGKKRWGFVARFFIAGALLFALGSTMPKRQLMTRDGKEYESGGIRWIEGLDPAGLIRAYQYSNGNVGKALLLTAEELFVSPGTKTAIHGLGAIPEEEEKKAGGGALRLPSDEIFNTYKSSREIFAEDLNLTPQAAFWKDVRTSLELVGAIAPASNDTRYMNTAIGLSERLKTEKDPEKIADLKRGYATFIPVIADAKSASRKLARLSEKFGEKKKKAKTKAEISQAEKEYREERKRVIIEFNKKYHESAHGNKQTSFLRSILGVNEVFAAETENPNIPTPKTPTEEAALSTPNASRPEFSSPTTKTIAQEISRLEGYHVEGSLANRQNNPGNLKYAGQPGAIKGARGFANFETENLGWIALRKQIVADALRGMTLERFVSKYAPTHENNTRQYLVSLEQKIGRGRNEKLRDVISPTAEEKPQEDDSSALSRSLERRLGRKPSQQEMNVVLFMQNRFPVFPTKPRQRILMSPR